MQNRKFIKIKLGQNVCGKSNCALRTHSKALLSIPVVGTTLLVALVIYDHVLEFVIRGGKCIFVGSYTIQVRIRNAVASKVFL
jgi:hypothetical protein